eukprot:1142766-Pelagomonas_calceolata.AAC.13
MDNYNEALSLLKEAFDGHKGVLGMDHPYTMDSGNSLADCLVSMVAPAIHRLLVPLRQSAAGHAPEATLSTHQGKGYWSCSTLHQQNSVILPLNPRCTSHHHENIN